MRINTSTRRSSKATHEGAPAKRINAVQELRRTVLACLLWEKNFYEDGKDVADRIEKLAAQVTPLTLASLAVEARSQFHLRHVPLVLLKHLVKHGTGKMVEDAIYETIQRADELAEFVALYWMDGRKPLSNPMKRGLARAFRKFSPYQLAKYNRDGEVKLRDVLFLTHPEPADDEQAAAWKKLVDGTLESPDTWEVSLSKGDDKKETFERLIDENKLGYLALLRNLRGMADAGCDLQKIKTAVLSRRGAGRVLPFRYVAAARACPQLEPAIDTALLATLAESPTLPGTTIVLVDVSGSMDSRLSAKSDMTNMDAAAALASLIRGETVRVFTFTDRVVEVPHRLGMSGVDAVRNSQEHGGTFLGRAVKQMNTLPHDRLIVITDEQSADSVPDPLAKWAYMINVSTNRSGVGYGRWTHLDGWSEGILRFIAESEKAIATA